MFGFAILSTEASIVLKLTLYTCTCCVLHVGQGVLYDPPVILCYDPIAIICHGRFEKLFFWATGTNLMGFFLA